MEKPSVAIISERVGKTPEYIIHSFIFDEAYRLAIKGINVHIIRNKIEMDSLSHGMRFHGIERKINFGTILLMLRKRFIHSKLSFLSTPIYSSNISKVIERNRIDLIHAHFAYPEGLAGLLAKRRTGKPLVVTVHGADILVEPSVGYGIRRFKIMDSIVSRVLNEADAVLAASKATFNEVSKIVNDADKIHLIPNGVDIQRFNPDLDGSKIRENLGIEGCTMIFTLRHHEHKYGLEYLIRAAPMVMKESSNVVFVIGGDGSLRSFHEKLSTKLGVKEKIIFPGSILAKDVPYYYASSDMAVVPSIQEAFGLVVSEAMACGKPVIGTNIGGIPDQIINGHNGFLVKLRNPEEIAEKILWLISNSKEAKRMGMNGRKIVEENFNIDKRTDKIIQLYGELIK